MSHTETARKNYAKWAVDLAIHEAFAGAGRDDVLRRAFARLLTAVQSRSPLLRPQTGGGGRSWEQPAHFVKGLLALSRHHRDWVREPDTWQPPQVSPREVFRSLCLQLLATHTVPPFMTSVWLLDEARRARQQQTWFKHVARGNSIRGAAIPGRLNKKMAYCFSQAPDHYSVDAALRWGESCCVREPKGRNANRLTTRRRLKRQSRNRNRACSLAAWKPVPIADFRYVELAKHKWSHLAWTIEQILDDSSLIAEGDTMCHCVAAYSDLCADGTTSIWSMKSHGTLTYHRILTIEVDPKTRTIIQARGLRNAPHAERARRVMSMWAERERLVVADRL